jgi:ABC-type Zn uptake system ZnuABC Zn-binding protein ZnuA
MKKVKVLNHDRFTYHQREYQPGDVVEMSDADAEVYVSAGYVEEVKESKRSRK